MGYSERLLALAVMGTAPLLAAPECNLPRPTLNDNVFFQTETLDAEAQVAVTAPAPEHPSGRVYISANRFVYHSLNGGTSWTPVSWNALQQVNPECNIPSLGPRGDTDVVVPQPTLAPGGFQHAYVSALFGFFAPEAVAILRTGDSGRFDEPSIQCRLVPKPASAGLIDKTSAALSNFFEDALYVSYQDGGTAPPDQPPPEVSHIWLQRIPLDETDGSLPMLDPPPPVRLQAPGEPGPATMHWGDCTPQPIDHMGRGNLYATPFGTLYLTFSNNRAAHNLCVLEEKRIYVAKLTPPNRFISCVDEFITSDCAIQGHIEETDPEIVVDTQTQKIAVVYARPEFFEPVLTARRIFLATAPLNGQGWTRQVVYPGGGPYGTGDGRDQSQPAIALTSFTDVIDRVFSGTIFVTWYHSTIGGRVERRARGFFSVGAGWQSNTTAFPISAEDFFPIDPFAPWPENRGVYEYQGVAHHPGLLNATGGWIGVWTQPFPAPLDPPSDDDFRIAFATWL